MHETQLHALLCRRVDPNSGLNAIGQLALLQIACTWIAALTILPAVLRVLEVPTATDAQAALANSAISVRKE